MNRSRSLGGRAEGTRKGEKSGSFEDRLKDLIRAGRWVKLKPGDEQSRDTGESDEIRTRGAEKVRREKR